MNTSRAASHNQPPLRYNYKTHTTPSRPSLRKQSRVKAKKENKTTHQSSHLTSHLYHSERQPLSSVKGQNNVLAFDMGEFHRNESLALKKKNDHLEEKIRGQGEELAKLKQEMGELKQSINQNVQNKNRQLGQAYRNNHSALNSYSYQCERVNKLKAKAPQPVLNFSKEIERNPYKYDSDPQEVSRRKEIMQHYEDIGQEIQIQGQYKPAEHSYVTKKELHYDETRDKYTQELRKLQEELSVMKEKGMMVEVLQKQIENKNQCIDFLRSQLEIVQTNSKQLLSVIGNLEKRIEDMEGAGYSGYRSEKKRRADQSFETFSGSRY